MNASRFGVDECVGWVSTAAASLLLSTHTRSRESRQRKKVVILCTHGMFLRKKLEQFWPSRTFFFNCSPGRNEQNHDLAVE